MELPKDIEIERIILGTMLSRVDAVNQVMDVLDASDFYQIEHSRIFLGIKTLYEKDYSIDPETVYHEIEPKSNKLLAYMYEILSFKISSDLDSLVEKIKEKSKLRKHVLLVQGSIKEACGKEVKSDEFYSQFCNSLDKIFIGMSDKTLTTPKEVLENYEDDMHFLSYVEKQQDLHLNGKSTIRGMSTGYELLDNTLSGLCKGHMVVIAARPGVGKSTFALNLMNRMLKNGESILFFTMEMTAQEVIGKLASIESGVNYRSFTEGRLSGSDYQKLVEGCKTIEKYDLYIEEQQDLKPSQIKARARRNIQNYGVKAVFIDYLTCITPEVRTNSREEGVRDISSSIRKMAKGFKVPFICVAQENRDSEKSDSSSNRTPKKTDLAQSGSIEQDAHSIIILRRPEIADPMDKAGIIQLWIVKNRFGEERRIEYLFQGDKSLVKEFEYEFK